MIPKKPVPPSIACIKRREGRSFCGREVYPQEFLFTDVAYALRHYRHGTCITACEDCVAVCEMEGAGSPKNLAPPATRGEENDK